MRSFFAAASVAVSPRPARPFQRCSDPDRAAAWLAFLGGLLAASCSPRGAEQPGLILPLPDPPAVFTSDLGRGLADPTQVALALDGRSLLALESAEGRVARIDLATGKIDRLLDSGATGLQVAPDGGAVLVMTGGTDGANGACRAWQACGHGILRIDLGTGSVQQLPVDVPSSGFFLDSSGAHYYTASVTSDGANGVERVDLATGAHEQLETCHNTRPLLAIDPDGRWVLSSGIIGGTPNTGDDPYLSSCDLAGGAPIWGPDLVDQQNDSLSLGCTPRESSLATRIRARRSGRQRDSCVS